MKGVKWRILCIICILCFLLCQFSSLTSIAQFSTLYDFGSKVNGTYPYSALISDGIFLYGMTSDGGANQLGTIYKVKPDGTGFTRLLDFDGTNGSNPYGSLTFDGTFLYGMARSGGANGQGIIFKIMPDGTGFINLLDFSYTATGGFPYGSLISDGTFLYGMTTQGGSAFFGTIFKIKPDGTDYTKLYDFDSTNGATPYGSLISDGPFLYGMTSQGGLSDFGTIFKIKSDGTEYTRLLDFNGTTNGGIPFGSLIADGSSLYGMTFYGGSGNKGTIFKIMPDGTGYTKYLDFDFNTSGANPKGSLVSDGTFLYGMTTQGGTNFSGTIFKMKTDGTGFDKLVDSSDNASGPSSEGTLLIDEATLYGVKSTGGHGGLGTVFKINNDGSSFSRIVNFEISGNTPTGSLLSDGTFLFGMTSVGGANSYGTIFKIKPDGADFEKLLDFDGDGNGGNPYGSLISDGIFLYGMTNSGGTNNLGTVFKIKPDGTEYLKLLDLDLASSGGNPNGSLFWYDSFLYGMASNGGSNSFGTIFKVKPDGTEFTKFHDFDYSNGAYPNESLISDGMFLYGTTNQGGIDGFGTIFKVMPDGTSFTKLHDFEYSNGANPYGSLTLENNLLYGMTKSGGLTDNGTIFQIKPDGTSFVKLLDFDGTINGGSPYGSFISDGTYLYGLTFVGGLLGYGTMFKIQPDGTSYSKLVDLNHGANPKGSLISDGTFLYGMTTYGGANNLGTLFKRSVAAATTITNFTPAEGVPGTTITINGIDFNPTPANNIVKFNNTVAIVKSSTASTLTVIVPEEATSGPISVTANGTDTSITDFFVSDLTIMENGIVQNCDILFVGPEGGGYDDLTKTFLPVSPTDKVKVSFSIFSVQGDVLYVYDGPSTSSPLIAALEGSVLPNDIVAGGPSGELTFKWVWGDGNTNWEANISCQSVAIIQACNTPFLDPGGNGNYLSNADYTRTFLPVNSSDKIRVSFSSFSTEEGYDSLSVYDGSSTSSPLIAILAGDILPSNITATGPDGSLTFVFRSDGDVESSGWEATISCISSSSSITIITQPNDATVCEGAIATFTTSASGPTNITYQWQFSPNTNSPFTDITNGGGYSDATTNTLSVNTTSNFGSGRYRCKINGDSAAEIFTIDRELSINTKPVAPQTINKIQCGPGAVTLTASGGANGQYRWYTKANGGVSISGEVNASYSTPALTSTTTYFVSINNGSCESPRTAIIATILPLPSKPTITSTEQITIGLVQLCLTPITLSAPTGFNYTWSSGQTSRQITIVQPDNYSVVVKDNNGCSSLVSDVIQVVINTSCINNPPVINTAALITTIGGFISIDLTPFISDPDNNLDPNSIQIIGNGTENGGKTTLSGFILDLDYSGIIFSGDDVVTIRICDQLGVCIEKQLAIEVIGAINIYTGISPNDDGKNDAWIIEHVDLFEKKKKNHVTIYNRWGDVVWEESDYNNTDKVFTGENKNKNELPSGSYFYKIEFPDEKGDERIKTGFLSLKR